MRLLASSLERQDIFVLAGSRNRKEVRDFEANQLGHSHAQVSCSLSCAVRDSYKWLNACSRRVWLCSPSGVPVTSRRLSLTLLRDAVKRKRLGLPKVLPPLYIVSFLGGTDRASSLASGVNAVWDQPDSDESCLGPALLCLVAFSSMTWTLSAMQYTNPVRALSISLK